MEAEGIQALMGHLAQWLYGPVHLWDFLGRGPPTNFPSLLMSAQHLLFSWSPILKSIWVLVSSLSPSASRGSAMFSDTSLAGHPLLLEESPKVLCTWNTQVYMLIHSKILSIRTEWNIVFKSVSKQIRKEMPLESCGCSLKPQKGHTGLKAAPWALGLQANAAVFAPFTLTAGSQWRWALSETALPCCAPTNQAAATTSFSHAAGFFSMQPDRGRLYSCPTSFTAWAHVMVKSL